MSIIKFTKEFYNDELGSLRVIVVDTEDIKNKMYFSIHDVSKITKLNEQEIIDILDKCGHDKSSCYDYIEIPKVLDNNIINLKIICLTELGLYQIIYKLDDEQLMKLERWILGDVIKKTVNIINYKYIEPTIKELEKLQAERDDLIRLSNLFEQN